jgi:hypothetical protein
MSLIFPYITKTNIEFCTRLHLLWNNNLLIFRMTSVYIWLLITHFDLRILITPLVYSNTSYTFSHCVVCSSSFSHCVVCSSSFSHCVVCSSSIYGFRLPLWYLYSLPSNRITRTPLKTEDELMCSRKIGSYCSTSGTRRVNLVTNPVIWGRTGEYLRQVPSNISIF